MDNKYCVKQIKEKSEIFVEVPGSKSITNRALLLAAISECKCRVKGILFSDDSRAFLDCLQKLGFDVDVNECEKEVTIQGTGGRIPNRQASVNVRSAGTAARFLTVMLAFAGGNYEMNASEQMCKRPMQPLLQVLQEAGVCIEFLGEEGHFPFRMKADKLNMNEVSIDTKVSSQFASALLMSAALSENGLRISMSGDRTEGSYIRMTLAMMEQFGLQFQKENGVIYVPAQKHFGVATYQVEPDVSGACYFYAMAPLLKTDVIVKNVHQQSLQGDIKFIDALEEMGCKVSETPEGILVSGKHLEDYEGLTISMKDFSDQTMTMAAIAPFAKTPTYIQNVGHIRFQESDRISAIITELNKMGIVCREMPETEGIYIEPGTVRETEVETYEDHRMAMAFSLIGVKTGKITILNPGCCKKTFENFFEVLETVTE